MSAGSALVIGLGRAGQRYSNILRSMGWRVSVVSSHKKGISIYSGIHEALKKESAFDLAIIASATNRHLEDFNTLIEAGHQKPLLLEKPLGFRLKQGNTPKFPVAIGFNLRYHPLIQAFGHWLGERKKLHASLEIRRHLPSMRGAGLDYKKSYSCFQQQGGGVLNDFSHELDLAEQWFGSCLEFKVMGGKLGGLHGDALDSVAIIARYERCPLVNIQFSYLDTKPERKIKVICEGETGHIELDSGNYDCDGLKLPENCSFNMEETYKALLEGLLRGDTDYCTLDEAEEIQLMIQKIHEDLS